jgi:integrase
MDKREIIDTQNTIKKGFQGSTNKTENYPKNHENSPDSLLHNIPCEVVSATNGNESSILTPRKNTLKIIDEFQGAYHEQMKAFEHFVFCKNLSLNSDGLKANLDYLRNRNYSARTINLRLAAGRKLLMCLFDKSEDSFDLIKRYDLERKLKSIKGEQLNQRNENPDLALSREETERLLPFLGPRTRTIFKFLLKTGLRIFELINIRKNRIIEGEKKTRIRIRGKRGKERWIEVGNDLYRNVLITFPDSAEFLFSTRSGQPYTRQNIYKMLSNPAMQHIGKKCGPHKLRHTCATRLLEMHPNKLEAISKLLGHSSTAITLDIYVHDRISSEEIEEAVI